jgi:hypothetical protein
MECNIWFSGANLPSDKENKPPSSNGEVSHCDGQDVPPNDGGSSGHSEDPEPPLPWEPPVPLGIDYPVPAFPLDCLPGWLREWAGAEAEATQTPADLAAMLALAVCGAAAAGKFRVQVRDGWPEPVNLYAVVALPPGDRKSAVFADAIAPVQEYEREEQRRMAQEIAEKASEHRVLEGRLKEAERKAAHAENEDEATKLRDAAKQLARELAAHQVPDPPQLYCDDVPPEKLAKLLARQGGRILQASPEGTAFEIVKGRYSETANFEVYLKGHAGDALRVDRISREQDTVDRPALSLALAVQPDVIRGLADQSSLRGRGFLARFLYAIPKSLVGRRTVAPAPVPEQVAERFRSMVLALWKLPGSVDETGKPTPNWLRFSPGADRAMRSFESWLEPQLAEGEELSHLAGWANKLAGAIARIAGILHVADGIGQGRPWQEPIREETVIAAIRLGRDYLLPHALAAFGMMGADPRIASANQVLRGIQSLVEGVELVESAPLSVSRRQIHQKHRGLFNTVDDLDPILDLLVKHNWLRSTGKGERGRGHRGPTYFVNPAIKSFSTRMDTQRSTHSIHSTSLRNATVEQVEEVEQDSGTSDGEIHDLHGDAYEGDEA